MDQSPTLEKFENDQRFARLGVRRHTFYDMVRHLENSLGGWIIETGTAWDQDNWEGQGQSTLIFDWACAELGNKFRVLSIDQNEAGKKNCKNAMHISFIVGESVKTLSELPIEYIRSCRLLYLDSFDWSEEANLDSSFHHMAELACVWPLLPSGCMIVVDDRHAPLKGKHWMVEAFMQKLGIKPVFCAYQIGWIKP